MPETTEHRKPIRLAANAFHAALAQKWDAAQRALQRINDECGPEGLADALIALCDTLAAHATGGDTPSQRVRISFMDGNTGRLDEPGSPQVPAEVQWAGRLIAARAEMDEDKFRAVLNELPHDGAAVGRHVWSLLQLVAWQVNGLPRGYARMGQGGTDA
ncbi:MAG TPA: hypothetical protein VGW74_02665 [Propionibacteriaceae bacterium]|nr:hypothetical protein [Propionibacteriaceae bacterium]